jgi:hypothetical protein
MAVGEPTAEMRKEYEARRFRNEGNQQPSCDECDEIVQSAAIVVTQCP